MMSLQEIQSAAFEKAVFGGYDTKSVDDFLERITEDYAALQKENIALKSKMKVLVDKIEEYRSVEDSMRKALVSAQGIADEIVSKAKTSSAEIEKNARAQSEEKLVEYKSLLASEKERVEALRFRTRDFISNIIGLYKKELEEVSQIGDKILLEEQMLSSAENVETEASATVQEQPYYAPAPSFAPVSAPVKNSFEDAYVAPPSVEVFEETKELENLVNSFSSKKSGDTSGRTENEGLDVQVFEITLGNDKADNAQRKNNNDSSNLQFGKTYTID